MFLNDWKNTGLEGMLRDFGITEKEVDGAKILLATYAYQNYEGQAYVLFERDGKLHEVIAYHCSCYGLSEQGYSHGQDKTQWEPEETTVEAVRHRLDSAYEFDGCRDELRQVLDSL